MSKQHTPFRFETVGSFLRPDYLKKARLDFENGKITKEELTAVEDKAIIDLVEKQKKAGYHVITDGEFRRATWHLDFMWGFEGVAHEQTGSGVQFDGELASLEDTYLVGKIKAKKHPFVEYFRYLKQFEDENTIAKYTIPAPEIITTGKLYQINLILKLSIKYRESIQKIHIKSPKQT